MHTELIPFLLGDGGVLIEDYLDVDCLFLSKYVIKLIEMLDSIVKG